MAGGDASIAAMAKDAAGSGALKLPTGGKASVADMAKDAAGGTVAAAPAAKKGGGGGIFGDILNTINPVNVVKGIGQLGKDVGTATARGGELAANDGLKAVLRSGMSAATDQSISGAGRRRRTSMSPATTLTVNAGRMGLPLPTDGGANEQTHTRPLKACARV